MTSNRLWWGKKGEFVQPKDAVVMIRLVRQSFMQWSWSAWSLSSVVDGTPVVKSMMAQGRGALRAICVVNAGAWVRKKRKW